MNSLNMHVYRVIIRIKSNTNKGGNHTKRDQSVVLTGKVIIQAEKNLTRLVIDTN